MRNLLAAAFAALALLGCQEAPEKKSAAPATQPAAAEAAAERPAPPPVAAVIVPAAEINQCKNDWVAAQAAELKISTAHVERRARFMRATPTTTVNVFGTSTAFTKSVWHSCEVAIKAARTAAVTPAAAPAVRATPPAPTVLKTDYDKLLKENDALRTDRNTLFWICVVLVLLFGVTIFVSLRKHFKKPATRAQTRAATPVREPPVTHRASPLSAFEDEGPAADDPSGPKRQ